MPTATLPSIQDLMQGARAGDKAAIVLGVRLEPGRANVIAVGSRPRQIWVEDYIQLLADLTRAACDLARQAADAQPTRARSQSLWDAYVVRAVRPSRFETFGGRAVQVVSHVSEVVNLKGD